MPQFAIEPECAKVMSAGEERALLGEAVQRNPGSPALRLRLARILFLMDAFDETIALLNEPPAESLALDELMIFARALLARGGSGDALCARDLAGRAFDLSSCDSDRSIALAEAAKANLRVGETDRAISLLEEALRLDPGNSAACKRLAVHWLRSGAPERALAVTDRLAAEGAGHSRLLSARMLALAHLGRTGQARDLLDPGGFLLQEPLPAPPGWDDIEAFNAELAAELSAHPGQRHGRYGTASRETLRIDAPATGAAPAARALLAHLARTAERHIAGLGAAAHPWLAARPERAILSSWCVITRGDGFEDWHTHPQGWMSGVYYAEVPQSVSGGRDEAGCLVIGVPEGLAGDAAAAAFGRTLVRPRAGLVLLFPSHGYHRTFPHGSGGRRICISFDIRPA
jgi:tetratricopeptide (TPR) repeat protein